MKSNKELKHAYEKLDSLSNDEYLQRIADLRQKAILDRNAQLSTSYRKGVKEGMEKSNSIIELEREKIKRLELEKAESKRNLELEKENSKKQLFNEKIQTAKKMLQENIDISIIKKVTGLSTDEINKLKNEK